ncbi:hypothetical protein I7I50_09825 [Histoplasma capsulatum G186AR]|uniref:Uncharacterized protein n=1 Tax=Ajellomyces capsulatus TaxID=5037 RepID=A0A8H8D3G7_AJECA|nr:hypothetical protein I7I52_10858 [Histoplasma capsulatum]QSS68751.1 hypothetical protein I7I50_09825 [Histoplasma capsulatum G186AR]
MVLVVVCDPIGMGADFAWQMANPPERFPSPQSRGGKQGLIKNGVLLMLLVALQNNGVTVVRGRQLGVTWRMLNTRWLDNLPSSKIIAAVMVGQK